MSSSPHAPSFADPPWHEPVDVATTLRSIPESASVAGMFFDPIIKEVQRRGMKVEHGRARYVAFQFYPMREFAQVLAEAAPIMFPNRPLRIGLRKIGRAAPTALIRSTLGRVMLGSVEGVHAVIEAMVKAYPINVRPSSATVLEAKDGLIVVRLHDIHYFLDSHHVGVFEGLMRHAGVNGHVQIRVNGPTKADLRCTWRQL